MELTQFVKKHCNNYTPYSSSESPSWLKSAEAKHQLLFVSDCTHERPLNEEEFSVAEQQSKQINCSSATSTDIYMFSLGPVAAAVEIMITGHYNRDFLFSTTYRIRRQPLISICSQICNVQFHLHNPHQSSSNCWLQTTVTPKTFL